MTLILIDDMRRGYVRMLSAVMNGSWIEARDMRALELTGVQFEFFNPLAPLLPIGVGRGVNLELAAVEALQVIAGESRSDLIRRAAPTFENVLVDPSDLDYGAYGPRLAYAIGDCLDLLRRDPGTRQAVAAIWKPDDLEHQGDKPCTVFMQFLVRRGATVDADETSTPEDVLEMYVYMRSQDVWLGVPYDVFTFSQLQHTMARELHLPVGRYVHNVTSFHLYERNLEAARTLVQRQQTEPADLSVDLALPLGVVSVGTETGFEVASFLLDDADEATVGNARFEEREVNTWFSRRMTTLHRKAPPRS